MAKKGSSPAAKPKSGGGGLGGALKGLVKWTLIAAFILALGSLVRVQGRSVSDHVRVGLSSAQRGVERSGVPDRVVETTSELAAEMKKKRAHF